ncbi:KAT8 regulatory NSL complex subunit 1-like protein [Centroberyx affinis]|uniref:KAT8 regulatory NSL complex subunit 1-like protein n=1 Tax=Centroberyx affinis TaxID=166261 RepID=UPI003A5B9BD2
MAPALTKILKDGHGIHLSSPLASVGVDSDGGAILSIELQEPQVKMTEDVYSQRMWLNLSSLPFLDSCLPESPLEFPTSSVLSPFLQASAGQCKTVLLPGPGSLLSLLSLSKSLKDAHQVATVLPGVPDMFFVPVTEHNSQEACLLRGHSVAPGCGPDGGDVLRSPPPLTSPPPPFSHGEIQPRCHAALLAPPSSLTQGEVAGVGCHPPAPVQAWGGGADCDQPVGEAVLEEQARWQLSRQAGLLCRAGRLQRRLQALLGEHAFLHCSQQLEGLKRQHQTGGASSDKPPPRLTPPAGGKPHFPSLESSEASSPSAELQELSRSGRAVLRGLQEALDSEATASSSSDDEPEDNKSVSSTSDMMHSSSSRSSSRSERRWLEERAEVGSRWSWLLLRLAELEGRIQQLGELHQHIRSSKGGVVLAESQPLTDRQIQQTLLRETAGLCYTVGASDADTEPSSPTRLLRNIERQSAQLSQIVNSLMPPLSLSPLSKQPQAWKGIGKRAFSSGQRGEEVFSLDGPKRRRMGARRRQQLLQADASCVCARTRPLVTYHKPRLFTFHTHSTSSPQDLESSTSTLSSSFSSSSCSSCSSCDPSVLCSDPACSSSSPLTSRTSHCRAHPVLSLSFDTPLSHHLQRALAREEWSQRPLVVNAKLSSPGHYNRLTHSSTPLHSSHNYKHHARHQRASVRGVSPIGWAGSAQMPHRRAYQRKRKKRNSHRVIEDEEDVLYQLCDPEESSEEALEETYTQTSQTRKQASQGLVRRRQGESVYSIDNIVIPMSLAATAKVEKLQYKDILTPSWRVVDSQSLMKEEEEDREEEWEVLTDAAFAQRHLASEQREKLRWLSWGKSRSCRRPTRSGSRSSGSGEGVCASGEESSMEWSCSQLDTDEQPSWEEWQPRAPWEPRVFPLDEEEEEALRSDEEEQAPSKWSETSAASASFSSFSSSSSSSTAANESNSHFSSSATPPSAGQSRNNSLGGC